MIVINNNPGDRGFYSINNYAWSLIHTINQHIKKRGEVTWLN